jgi:1,4-dihydroxy-2-naphthoyl-CoA hydrolase
VTFPFPTEGGAWLKALGFEIEELTGARVSGHIDVGPEHHTPFGTAHGGMYATIVESAGSLGACAAVVERGERAVGVHNSTEFLRPVIEGRIDVVATPILQGRVQQLWEVEFRRSDGKAVALGRLRLQNLPMPPTG